MTRRAASVVCLLAASMCAACSFGTRTMVMELRGAVVYERPRIESVVHTLTDRRAEGGAFVVRVTLTGDPGLVASFDITPDVVERHSIAERDPGVYVGEFRVPRGTVGGPFTVVGRLRHEAAGESVQRDPQPVLISLPSSRP